MNRVRFLQAGWTAAWALIAASAQAQSVNDYRLPSSSPTPTMRAQGPVTPDNPVLTPPRPAPTPSAVPSPAATPAPSAAPPAAAPRLAPRAAAPLRPDAEQGLPAATSAPPAAAPSVAPPPGFPSLGASPAVRTAAPATTPAASDGAPIWPWVLGAIAALGAAIGGLVWWRRRREEQPLAITFEPPVVPQAAPRPEPVEPLPMPEPAAAAPLSPAAPPSPPPRGIALALEATRMSASLMATTLSYRLKLTNHTETALSGLAIEGDMIAAQAQVPAERQVANAAEHLEQRHALATLAPGESAEFAGDIRVPLNAIVPIQAGGHRLFIPLARFRVEAGADGRGRIAVTRTYVVGEEPEAVGAQLKPFRLDLGPRTYSRLGQRAVS